MTMATPPGIRRGPFVVALGLVLLGLFVAWRFQTDIEQARARVAHGSMSVATSYGQIEYQEA
jgi:hypothetical protein